MTEMSTKIQIQPLSGLKLIVTWQDSAIIPPPGGVQRCLA